MLVDQSCPTLCDPMEPARLLCPWDCPGKNTGVGCHSLLHGIFQTQGSNLSLPHCRQILYHLSHQGHPCLPTRVTTIQTSIVIVLHVYEFNVNKIIHTVFFFFWLLCVFLLFASCMSGSFLLVVMSGSCSELWCAGFSLQWLLLLHNMVSRACRLQRLPLLGSRRAQAQ